MRTILLVFLLLYPIVGLTQINAKQYWFQFTDKANTPYALDNPSQFLSQRALARRARQNIQLDSSDLPVDPAYVQAVLDEGAFYLTHSKWFNSVSVAVLNDDIRDSILDLPFVQGGLPVAKRPGDSPKDDKFSPLLTAKSLNSDEFTDTDYGDSFNQIDMIGGVALHNQGYRGEGMLIAVLDAGFTNVNQFPVFDSLMADGRFLGGWDFVDQDNTVFENHSHGQSVLSTMAGYVPGSFIGTAPKASYLLLRTEEAGSETQIELDYWVAGAEYADSAGADIINSSLGYTTFDGHDFDFSYSDLDGNTVRGTIGADMAASKGILVVNSAGNSGDKPWQYIGAPSDGDSVLAIGAVGGDRIRASFSSTGPSADGDVKPNVCAQGFQAAIVNGSGSISGGNGTSFAGPIIAGMAACLWQANHDSASNMDIFHAIQQSADRFNNPDDFYGYGIPNFAKANLMLKDINPSDEDESELLTPYPNPFQDSFKGTFYSSSRQNVLVRLVNNLGQEIRRFETIAQPKSGVVFEISGLQDLAEGIYTLHIEADSGKYFEKLVKVRN